MSELEETEQLALEWSHMVVVMIGFDDYKPEEVVEKRTVEQEPMMKKTQ